MDTNLENRLIRDNAYVREICLPRHINAVTSPNDDGTFDIYINTALSPCEQRAALEHELNHIEKNHFYDDVAEIQSIEAEADLIFVSV